MGKKGRSRKISGRDWVCCTRTRKRVVKDGQKPERSEVVGIESTVGTVSIQ